MAKRYELRKNPHGKWEVADYWDDGVTVQVRYFDTLEEATAYLREKEGV